MIFYGLPLIPNSLMWWVGQKFIQTDIFEFLLFGLEAVNYIVVASRFPTINKDK